MYIFTKLNTFFPILTDSRNMIDDDSKLFLHGLPPDCQENTLKDFLEGTCTFRSLKV